MYHANLYFLCMPNIKTSNLLDLLGSVFVHIRYVIIVDLYFGLWEITFLLKAYCRAVIRGLGLGIFSVYFEVCPRPLWYKTSMLTSLQQLESPAICSKSPPTSKISDSPVLYTVRPLHGLVMWYEIKYVGMQITQWDFQNKGKLS